MLSPPKDGARILIVDDERQNRQLLEAMLRPEGYVLLTAEGGEQALALIAQRPPDLILLDVMMPGMNGYQVAGRIKGSLTTRHIPIIMITALDDRDSRMRGLNDGAEDYLTKPVERAELCVRVRNLLRLKSYGDAQEKATRLLASSPGVSDTVSAWSTALAEEIAGAIGARAIGIWEVNGEAVTPVSDRGLRAPSRDQLADLGASIDVPFLTETAGGTLIRVTGPSGELCGALLVSGADVAWGDTHKRLLAGFAHRLGGALEMSRMRHQLVLAEESRVPTRDLYERGVKTLQICPTCKRCYGDTLSNCPVDGSPLDSSRALPYLLLGRYRFLHVLGEGGMGVVLSAHDERLRRDVAVKLLRPDAFQDPELKQRFAQEARAVAGIQHPGVVELHDSGELEDGTAFLVMERLAGCDLRHVLLNFGRGKPAQVARLARQGGAALRAAHRAGVIHRDVKPENVFLVDDPSGFRVKLLDFGIAKSMRFDTELTQKGQLIGTPGYMSPENVRGEDVDGRSDVYSFAAVAYEALTGRRVITGADLARVLDDVLTLVPPLVSTFLPGIPPELDAAFESALAKDREHRPRDPELWGALVADLLDTFPGDAATEGWPTSSAFFSPLGDACRNPEPTVELAGEGQRDRS